MNYPVTFFSIILLSALHCLAGHKLSQYTKYIVKNFIAVNTIAIVLPLVGNCAVNNDVGIDLNRIELIRKTETFLTNPVLETMRKMDQVDKDENENSNQKALLLYPIIEISKEIEQIKSKLSSINDNEKVIVNEIQSTLASSKYNSKEFKKIVNRYSDNIFYQDPRRANIYLGGGAIPDSSMTQKYLYRNVALTSIDYLKDDISSIIKGNKWGDQELINDAIEDADDIIDAFDNYFKLSDPNDIAMALEIYKTSH